MSSTQREWGRLAKERVRSKSGPPARDESDGIPWTGVLERSVPPTGGRMRTDPALQARPLRGRPTGSDNRKALFDPPDAERHLDKRSDLGKVLAEVDPLSV